MITLDNRDRVHIFVLEFCPTDLEHLMIREKGLRNNLAITMVIHVLEALQFLGEKNILHRFLAVALVDVVLVVVVLVIALLLSFWLSLFLILLLLSLSLLLLLLLLLLFLFLFLLLFFFFCLFRLFVLIFVNQWFYCLALSF